MATYQIDGIDLDPQPYEHEWEYPIGLGYDGDAFPLYAKYSAIRLRVGIDICGHKWFDDWFDDSTITAHTLRVPRPGTVDDSVVYTGVIIDYIRDGPVVKRTGMRGMEMRVIHIEV